MNLNSENELNRFLSIDNSDIDTIILKIKCLSQKIGFPKNIEHKSILIKLLERLENKLLYENIVELLNVLTESKIEEFNLIEFEFNKGILILKTHQKFEEILTLYEKLINNKVSISNLQLLLDCLNSCYSFSVYSKSKHLIKQCVLIVKKMHGNRYELNQTFWKNNFDNLIRLQIYEDVDELILIYPFKIFKCETVIQGIIQSYINSNKTLKIFQLIQFKFELKYPQDDSNSFKSIFNIFIEEMTHQFENIPQVEIENIIEMIIKKNKITIKENVLEKFLIKVSSYNKDNFEVVERFLIHSDANLTEKILEKIIIEFFKIKEYFSILMILKLSKNKSLAVNYERLNLNSEILKDVICYIINNSDTDTDIGAFTDSDRYTWEHEEKNESKSFDNKRSESNSKIENSINNYDDYEQINLNDKSKKSLKSVSIKTSESLIEEFTVY